MKKVLLLCGGGGSEHDVSLVSVKHIEASLKGLAATTTFELKKDNFTDLERIVADFSYVIPCIHGPPGETGDIQSWLELKGVPYMGCNSEASKMCFNKITTKLWATALGVNNTPYLMLPQNDPKTVREFHKKHGDIVVKASNQGSSVGCYLVQKNEDPNEAVKKAFALSPFVLIEKRLKPRELEVSVYEYAGELQISYPGEIVCPTNFYSYEEKYSKQSETTTETRALNLTSEQVALMTDYSRRLFHGLKLRHLSRIDFFLENEVIYLNEINTFPGLTPISMFPKMMEANGHKFRDFLNFLIG